MKRIIVALLILIISALAAVMYNFTFPNIGILKIYMLLLMLLDYGYKDLFQA